MKPENWPDPVAEAYHRGNYDDCTPIPGTTLLWRQGFSEDGFAVGETLYTASQVRQIEAAAMEECAKLCESEFSNPAEKLYGQELAALIRAKVKEEQT